MHLVTLQCSPSGFLTGRIRPTRQVLRQLGLLTTQLHPRQPSNDHKPLPALSLRRMPRMPRLLHWAKTPRVLDIIRDHRPTTSHLLLLGRLVGIHNRRRPNLSHLSNPHTTRPTTRVLLGTLLVLTISHHNRLPQASSRRSSRASRNQQRPRQLNRCLLNHRFRRLPPNRTILSLYSHPIRRRSFLLTTTRALAGA